MWITAPRMNDWDPDTSFLWFVWQFLEEGYPSVDCSFDSHWFRFPEPSWKIHKNYYISFNMYYTYYRNYMIWISFKPSSSTLMISWVVVYVTSLSSTKWSFSCQSTLWKISQILLQLFTNASKLFCNTLNLLASFWTTVWRTASL